MASSELQPYTPRAATLCTLHLPVDRLLGLQAHDQLVARAVRERAYRVAARGTYGCSSGCIGLQLGVHRVAVRERADDARHGVELDAHVLG